MTAQELPKFPEKPTSEGRDYWRFKDYVGSYDACHGLYLNASADAWEQRARLAVEALTAVAYSGRLVNADIQARACMNALNAIGTLPPSQERTP